MPARGDAISQNAPVWSPEPWPPTSRRNHLRNRIGKQFGLRWAAVDISSPMHDGRIHAHRPEAKSVQQCRTMLSERTFMIWRRVAFVRSEIVFREDAIPLRQTRVAMHFRHNGGSRNGAAARVAINQGKLFDR